MIHFSLPYLLRRPLVFISGLSQGFGTTLIIKECAYINSFSILSLVRKGQKLNMWLIQKGWRLISFLFKIQRGYRVSDLCQSAPAATFKNHYLLDVQITMLGDSFWFPGIRKVCQFMLPFLPLKNSTSQLLCIDDMVWIGMKKVEDIFNHCKCPVCIQDTKGWENIFIK